MHSWPIPYLPELLPRENAPVVSLHDTATGQRVAAARGGNASVYVCGITPYDAAHLGHAATYVAFDLLVRAWLDEGRKVTYIQNVTDIDDPLLERAARDGVDWRDLAAEQTRAFTRDMTALHVVPPTHFVSVTEHMDIIAALARALMDAGCAYEVVDEASGAIDWYADLRHDATFDLVAELTTEQARQVFAQRGGDPERLGKRDPLDPMIWRGAREGEPSWSPAGVPQGRPGWHIECAAIAGRFAELPLDVQAGGSDLAFPHHAMSASHARTAGGAAFARVFAHAGMVGLDGEKMSKSQGNLVFVRELIDSGVSPVAVRLALLAHHYRSDWSFTSEGIKEAEQRLELWHDAFAREHGPAAEETVANIRAAIADDLDAPAALEAVDHWARVQREGNAPVAQGATGAVSRAVDSLLGVRF